MNDYIATNGTERYAKLFAYHQPRDAARTRKSYNNASKAVGKVLNPVQFTYRTFGQLIAEQQDATAVSISSAEVQYNYRIRASNSTTNMVRPSTLNYPERTLVSPNFER
jgi:hypothetical protein